MNQSRITIASRWADGRGGATTYLIEHAKRLRTAGWEVHLYSERPDPERWRQTGAVIHKLRGWP